MARVRPGFKRYLSVVAGILALLLVNISGITNLNLAQGSDLGNLAKISVASPEKDFPVRTVYIWTPPGNYDRSTLPVVYLLHGWPGSPSSMIAGVTKPLIAAFTKGAKPFIAVFPDGNAKTHVDSEWSDSYDQKAMIETWLTTNVIQSVESDRIRSNTERAIVGFSMGGYGAGIIGLHHPELFTQIATISGYFIIDDLTGAFGTVEKIKYQTPSNFLPVANKFSWFVSEGKNDFTHPIRGQAVIWTSKLKSVKAKYLLDQPPGYHDFTFVGNEIGKIANWLIWPKNAAAAPKPSASASASENADTSTSNTSN